jgi:hypothetical protein
MISRPCQGGEDNENSSDGLEESDSEAGELREKDLELGGGEEESGVEDLVEFVNQQSSSFPQNHQVALWRLQRAPLEMLLDLSVYHDLCHTAEHCLVTYDARIGPTDRSPDYGQSHKVATSYKVVAPRGRSGSVS